MSVYKCERCSKLFEMEVIPDITLHEYKHGYGYKRLNLCNVCHIKLIKWLKKEHLK